MGGSIKDAVRSAEITGSAPWDGLDMAEIQMLVCDLREQGRPVAEFGPGGRLSIRPRPGMKDYIGVAPGCTIWRYGLELAATAPALAG